MSLGFSPLAVTDQRQMGGEFCTPLKKVQDEQHHAWMDATVVAGASQLKRAKLLGARATLVRDAKPTMPSTPEPNAHNLESPRLLSVPKRDHC
jgi:hypothetical protein